jgi:hypothetical protein
MGELASCRFVCQKALDRLYVRVHRIWRSKKRRITRNFREQGTTGHAELSPVIAPGYRKREVQKALVAILLFVTQSVAHDVITTNLTYTRDVSRILAAHCLACHGTGSSIPLTSYAEVRPWAVSIKEQVLSRAMPPWGAVKGFGDLSPDNGLSQEDILILAAWVIGGAPEGDPRLLLKVAPPTATTNELPLLKDGITIDTRADLKQPLRVLGIRPLPTNSVKSSRVIARFPDGRIQPLVWLYQFEPEFKRTFTFRQPLDMPRGTVVESSTPLRFALEISPHS